jgi:hypothetical protein
MATEWSRSLRTGRAVVLPKVLVPERAAVPGWMGAGGDGESRLLDEVCGNRAVHHTQDLARYWGWLRGDDSADTRRVTGGAFFLQRAIL